MVMYGLGDGVPVRHATNELLLTISVNPTRRQLRDVLRSVLTNPHPRYRHVIYSGLALSGTGCWLLSDGPFTYFDFVAVLPAAKGDRHAPVYVSTFDDGSWTATRLSRDVPGLEVVLNPECKSPSPPERFIEGLSQRIGVVEGGALLETTETVGTISFARPTLYVFPAGDGGSSLFFGIRDLSVVCDAGVGRRPAFWDFVRHFSHVDVLIGSHAGADNIFGIETFVERQCSGGDLPMLPKLGHVIFNGAPDRVTAKAPESPTLLVHLPEEVVRMTNMLHDADIPPHVSACPAGGKTAHKINLYQKINQGSVDLYVAHPVEDSRELKEFRRQCVSHAPNFVSPGAVPLTNLVSIVAALVWKPSSSTQKPVRIFLPGSAPLAAIYEGLDRLQGVPLFESLSGSAKEQAPRPALVAKSTGSKPTARTTGPSQKTPMQSAPTARSPPSSKARERVVHTVTSPKSNREVSNRKSTAKTEPSTKSGRVAKPPQSTQPPSVEKVEHASETAVSSKAQTSLKTSPVDTELPVDEVVSAERGEVVHDVKADEPEEEGVEEAAARDSLERDSLERSVGDDAVQSDSLCGDDRDQKDHSEVHSEDEFDPSKPIKVEKTSDSDYGETAHKDVDLEAEGVYFDDDRIIPGLDDRPSPGLDIPSAGSFEKVDPAGELDTLSSTKSTNIVVEASEEANVPLDDNDPLCEAVHSRPVDTVVEDTETSHSKQTDLDEAEDAEKNKVPQETAKEVAPDEGAVHKDIGCEFDGKHSSGVLSDVQQITTSAPDEPADEIGDQEKQLEDVKVADTEENQELQKELDSDRETVTPDSGIMPQGLPSPQKEADWLETEHEDPVADAFLRGDADDVGLSLKAVDEDVALMNSAAAPSLTCEDGGTEKIREDHDVVMTSSEHTALDSFDAPERHECQQNTGPTSVESDSTLPNLTEGSVEKSDFHAEAEVDDLEDNTVSTGFPFDEKTKQDRDTAVQSNLRPEVGSPDFSDEPSPDTDEPRSEELPAEELETVAEEEPAPLPCDSDSHVQSRDHEPVPHNEELPNPAVNTDVHDGDKVLVSSTDQQQIETFNQPQHEDYPAETEPFSLTDPREPVDDALEHEADIPEDDDVVDDVPLSPVKQSTQEDIPRETEETSIYYTEPKIELTADTDRASDMELPVTATRSDAATAGDDPSEQPEKESSSPNARLAADTVDDLLEQPEKESSSPGARLVAGTVDDLSEQPEKERSSPDARLAAGTVHDDLSEQPEKESSSPDALEEPFDPIQSWGSPMGLPAPLNSDNGKKRESKDGGRHQTDGKTPGTGKTGAARDVSGGRSGSGSGRTAAKPGRPAERPAATRKPAGSAAGASKVGVYLLCFDCELLKVFN